MAVPVFGFWDYAVFLLILGVSTCIGLYFAWTDRKEKDNQAFLTGNKQLSWYPVSLSMAASFLSSNAMLGLPAEVFLHGSVLWWGAVSSTIGILVAMFAFLPMFYRMNITSINELLYLGVVLYGPSLALGSVTGFPVWSSILLNGAVCTFYTAIGGIKAVVWTDALQMLLIYVGYAMVATAGLKHLGGFGALWNIAGEGGRLAFAKTSLNVYETYTTWNLVLAWTVFWLTAYCASQTQVQRYSSMASLSEARKALFWNIPIVGSTILLSVLCGLVLYAVYGNCDPRIRHEITTADQLMPYLVQDLLRDYPGLCGLLVASVFSGSLSTLSSGYNALAAVTWDDFVKHRVNWDGKRALVFTKLTAATYGALSIAVAFLAGSIKSIVQATASLNGALNGPLFAMFFIGFFLPRVKEKGAFVGVIGGMAVSTWLAMGSIYYPRETDALMTSTAQCSEEVFNSTMVYTLGSNGPVKTPPGMLKFYHISYIWTAFVGFIVSVVFTLIASICLDWTDTREVDDRYIAPFLRSRSSAKKPQKTPIEVSAMNTVEINGRPVQNYESAL